MISLQQLKDSARPGDIVGFSGNDAAADIINVMTGALPRWGLSHVGMLCPHPDYGLLLYESTTFNRHPCVIKKKLFAGTQAQYPADKIFTYPGRVWLYRMQKPLRPTEVFLLQCYLNSTVGIPYDMIGAVRSGGHLFNWLESKLHSENLAHIFCSEWCVAAYDNIERFDTDNRAKWNPNKFIRECKSRAIHSQPERIL